MTRSVVTGAAGFVGRWLVRRLVERGDSVVATDLNPLDDLPDGVQFSPADLRDPESLKPLCQHADVVFHSASVVHTRHSSKDTLRDVNVAGTRNLLDACGEAGVARLVYVSSASVVYEGQDIEGGDERLPYARKFPAPYAATKAEAEAMVVDASRPGLKTISIRPHVVFGPGDTRFLPAVLTRAKAGKLKLGVGRRQNLSDFTYIDNLIDSLILADTALQRQPPVGSGEAYFVSNGEPMDFFDFIGRVLAELELPPIRGRVPFALAYGAAAVAEQWQALRGVPLGHEDGLSRFAVRYMCTHHYFSIAKARRDLGYAPKVDLTEGIRRTCAYLREEGWA